ncbi:MAG: VanZ family protein [Candidatus Zixiibacteriota bacterium]|nr:MAG: VanZ family protein [candidate division Zixibacteria bacterium]
MKPFIPAMLWAVMIFIVSSIPDLSTPSLGFKFTDKMAHFGEFFFLGLLVTHAFSKWNISPVKVFWISACVSGLYGVMDEFHQLFVPGRQTDGFDMLADILGAVSASGIYVLKLRKRIS